MESDEIVLFAGSTSKKTKAHTDLGEKSPGFSEDKSSQEIQKSFHELHLDAWLIESLKGLGIHKPTPVQQTCIPAVLHGGDVVAAAKTGSGKTAAFALPILHNLARDPFGFYALVLTPTRELALQIAEQFQVLGKAIKATICVCVGGLDMMAQSIELTKKPHIVIATPGRLSDLLSSGQLQMHRLKYLVFDEADRLLEASASFMKNEIPEILRRAGNQSTQWLSFSATISSCVPSFHQSQRPGKTIFRFNGNAKFGTVETAKQFFMLVPSQVRDAHLVQLLREQMADRTVIIFVGKCKTCELVVGMLRQLKISVVGLHGQMPQKSRIASLSRFRSGSVKCLVTTDVGSRGLDIPSVEVVINFDLPADARDYVHRIGRTARAGRPGTAIAFVHELDLELLKSIEERTKQKLEPYTNAPTESEVVKILNEVSTAKRVTSMALHDRKFGEKAENNKRKWESS